MKKVIVAALAVAMAVVANAASVNWSMANGTLAPSPDGSASSGRLSYYTMLVFTADQASAVDSAIAAGKFADLGDMAVSKSVAAKSGTLGGAVNGLTGSSVTLFGVLLDTAQGESIADAGYYYKTGTITAATYDPTGSDPATSATFSATQMTGAWTATSGGDVPEPTSGVLLLVGAAMLALRRKQK